MVFPSVAVSTKALANEKPRDGTAVIPIFCSVSSTTHAVEQIIRGVPSTSNSRMALTDD